MECGIIRLSKVLSGSKPELWCNVAYAIRTSKMVVPVGVAPTESLNVEFTVPGGPLPRYVTNNRSVLFSQRQVHARMRSMR
jgi:hypothetical protein